MRGNISKISGKLGEEGIEALLITSGENRFYATGFRSTAGDVIVTASGDAALFIDARYFEEASSRIEGAQVVLSEAGDKYYTQLAAYLTGHGIRRLAVEEDTLTYSGYMKFKDKLPVELVPGQKVLNDLRAVKSRQELEIMVKAQRIAEKAFEQLLSEITLDMTEKEAASELHCLMLKNGAEDKSFDTILVSGAQSSVPHGKPRDVKIERGFLTVDFGAIYGGYCSDTTRTVAVGEPTEEMRRVYDTVLRAQKAAIEFAHAGMDGREFDGSARSVIADAGYGEYFTHSLSHGLGIEIHEQPFSSVRSEGSVPEGAVVSVEPGIYLPGKFGVRIEDVIYVTGQGCEDITNLNKELIVICP